MTMQMADTTQKGIIAGIRKEFFALRNGMIADTLRKGGLEQKYIFGLQLPQIKDIAERFRPESDDDASEIARTLWADRECREARLLACHIMPPAKMKDGEASEWASDATTREEADILAFRLLRHLPSAADLSADLENSSDPLKQYAAEAIRRFI